MKLLIVGAEFTGTTTLANAFHKWKENEMGCGFTHIHDHFKIPRVSGHPDDTTPEEQKMVLAMTPKLKEMYSRYSLHYHVQHYRAVDNLDIGLHIEDAVYAPLYFGFGLPDEFFNRREFFFDHIEELIKEVTSDPVIIVHLIAESDVLRQRMKENNRENAVMQEKDIDEVLKLFEEGVARSTLGPTVKLDTSKASIEDSVSEFAEKVQPHLTAQDRERIEANMN